MFTASKFCENSLSVSRYVKYAYSTAITSQWLQKRGEEQMSLQFSLGYPQTHAVKTSLLMADCSKFLQRRRERSVADRRELQPTSGTASADVDDEPRRCSPESPTATACKASASLFLADRILSLYVTVELMVGLWMSSVCRLSSIRPVCNGCIVAKRLEDNYTNNQSCVLNIGMQNLSNLVQGKLFLNSGLSAGKGKEMSLLHHCSRRGCGQRTTMSSEVTAAVETA